MARSPFDPLFEDLPDTLPVFPLAGALLLPRGKLPLNIFEPRYLTMVVDALAADRTIGMIQPLRSPGKASGGKETDESAPPLYRVGCAGRITAFEETPDGRFLINLYGVCRFAVAEEIEERNGYRRVRPSFDPYRNDLAETSGLDIDRDRLIESLKPYFRLQGVQADFEAIGRTASEALINSLAMVCPFQPHEKQALLEAPTLADRARAITTLIEMALHEADDAPPPTVRH